MMQVREDIAHSQGMQREPAPPGWETCAVCGCWDLASCWTEESGACWWVDDGLCSHCAEAEAESTGTVAEQQP